MLPALAKRPHMTHDWHDGKQLNRTSCIGSCVENTENASVESERLIWQMRREQFTYCSRIGKVAKLD